MVVRIMLHGQAISQSDCRKVRPYQLAYNKKYATVHQKKPGSFSNWLFMLHNEIIYRIYTVSEAAVELLRQLMSEKGRSIWLKLTCYQTFDFA